MKNILTLKILIIFPGLFLLKVSVASAQPDMTRVRPSIQQRLDEGNMLGISVAYIHPNGQTTYFTKGFLSTPKDHPVHKNTIFEIGSVTKTFTALILARMAQQHIVGLDDPIGKFLPDSVDAPTYKGRNITLRQLAMHTSGLPRLPSNLHPSDWLNPYADYTAHDLIQFLDDYKLSKKPGTSFQYSNLGAGLLGELLEKAAHKSYAQLLRKYITSSLGMTDTYVDVPKQKWNRFAQPFNYGQPVKHWTFPSLTGAGAIRSTLADMVTYLKAQMGLKKSDLKPAIITTQKMQFHIGSGNENAIGLAWMQSTRQDTILWHNGGTGGFHSFVGWNQENHTGVVILENGKDNIDDVGFHLLDPNHKLRLQLDSKVLKHYTGTYQLAPNFSITIIKRGGQLFEKATGQEELRIYPQSKTNFNIELVQAHLVFVQDKNGNFSKMELMQNGRTTVGKRIKNK